MTPDSLREKARAVAAGWFEGHGLGVESLADTFAAALAKSRRRR